MPSIKITDRAAPLPLIVGSGRVATHFGHYLTLKNVPFLAWNRKEHSVADLRKLASRASSVFLLIRDSAIEEFRALHLANFKGPVFHFSGALSVPGIDGFHPLMTFGPDLYDLAFYEKIHFAVSSKKKFQACFPALSNPLFELGNEDKALYHALCVISGNFPQILWQACLEKFRGLGVPQEALSLYLQRNLDNFKANPGQSLTGPLARKDKGTIEKNIAALPEDMGALYSAFVRYFCEQAAGRKI